MGRPKKNKEPIKSVEPEVVANSNKDSTAVPKESTGFKALMKALEKNYGEGSLAQANTIFDVEKIKTKVLLLDILLKGGLPTSSIITYYGAESTGKSLFSYIFGSVFTDKKQRVAIIDCEHAVDRPWLKKLGLDLDYVYIAQPKSLERAIDIAVACLDSREFGLIIFDSLTSAIPIEEMEKSSESQQMALQARLFSKMFKKLGSALQPENLTDESTYNKTIFIGIGQLREKVGFVMGNPQILPGGYCLPSSSEILTQEGFKKYTDISKGDIIPTVNMETQFVEYQPIAEVISYKETDFVEFSNKYEHRKFVCTPNHNIVLRKFRGNGFEFKKASTNLCRYMFPTQTKGIESALPKNSVPDSELKLLGWLLSDGSIRKRGSSYEANIYQSKEKYLPEIRKILDDCGLEYTETKIVRNIKWKVAHEFYLKQSTMKALIKKFGLSTERLIPRQLYHVDSVQFLIFLTALQHGDGEHSGGKCRGITSDKLKFIEQLAGLCMIHGVPVGRIQKTNDIKNSYRLDFYSSENFQFNTKTSKKFNDTAWCVTVPNKTFFVKQGKYIYITGNSVKHHSHYILKFSKGQVLTVNKEPVGREVRVKVEKAKYSPPLVSGIMEFRFDPPKVNNAKVLITYASQYGIIKRTGAWFTYKDVKECGADKLLIKIKEEHPEYLDEIKQALIEYDGTTVIGEEEEVVSDE